MSSTVGNIQPLAMPFSLICKLQQQINSYNKLDTFFEVEVLD